MSLSDYSDKQLKAELETREENRKSRPVLIPNPDLARLRQLCESYINTLATKRYEPKDYKHYIYEEVMIAFYGKDVWNFINKVLC